MKSTVQKIFHQLISSVCFVNLKNELLIFLGWPHYILEKLTTLYPMFTFFGFLFSQLKGIYKTCALHTQVNKQAIVARILFAGFFGIFSTSINKTLLDAQISEYNRKLSTTPNSCDTLQDNIHPIPTAPPQSHHLHHPLFLVLRIYRNILAITAQTFQGYGYPQSPVPHKALQQSTIDDTYEQIVEQPHTTNFHSQNNLLSSTRCAVRLDPSTVPFPIHPSFNANPLAFPFQT